MYIECKDCGTMVSFTLEDIEQDYFKLYCPMCGRLLIGHE